MIFLVITTHARIANRASKDYFYHYKKYLVVLGSVLPDINFFSHPHRGDNLERHIQCNEAKIVNKDSNFTKYIRLGNMLHYLCDYFCYAHKDDLDISHGTRHTKYEMEIGRSLKDGFDTHLRELPLSDQEELFDMLQSMKENYEKKPGNADRDLKYALSAVDFCLEYMNELPQFQKVRTRS